jgi:CheY-like chemotaxis protein
MNKKIPCVMIVDDSRDDCYLQEREIKKANIADTVIAINSGTEALVYLKGKHTPHADLIFLDINMPCMNGWDFLIEYKQLATELQSVVIIVMLAASGDPCDVEKAKTWSFVSDCATKPLTKPALEEIVRKYFSSPSAAVA